MCKSYNKSITALLWVGQYGGIFSSRLLYCPSLRSSQYCQPRTEYSPVLPSQSCSNIYVTLHRKISHNAGEEFLELARAGQSTFNQLSFGTKISFIPGSVPELRHFEVTEVKKSTMEKRSKTLIIAWVGVN